MKKTISALVLGAAAVGFATADLKINLNYRNGADMFKYYNTRESGAKASKTLFDLGGWNSGKDNVQLRANGNIFSFDTVLQPTVQPGSEDSIGINRLVITANVGNFSFNTGFHNDGMADSTFRAKKDSDAENGEQGTLERYKIGNTLTNALAVFSNNLTILTNSGANYFAQAGYKFGFGESFDLNATVSAISNYGWGTTSLGNSNKYLGWSVDLTPTFKDILGAEVFAKGQRKDENNYAFVFGGYIKLLCLPIMPESALGGAVGMYGGKVSDWSADLRLYFKLGDSVTLTTFNNFSKIMRVDGVKQSKDGGSASSIGGMNKFKSSQMLWDVISLRFKLTDTFTLIGTVGQQTDFDGGEKKDGTQLYVYPHVQIFASSAASIVTGVFAGLDGIGANKATGNEKFDVLVRVPVLFRVKL